MWDSGQGAPTFLLSAYLDDQFWSYYDSSTKRALPRGPWIKKAEEDPSFWDIYTEQASRVELRHRRHLLVLGKHHNQSEGVVIWQKRFGCELGEDKSKRGYDRCGNKGRDFMTFDYEALTWIALDADAEVMTRVWNADPAFIQKKIVQHEDCIQMLQRLWEYGKEAVLRKEPPAVKVSRKVSYDSLETLTCRAHGFYPKEINATWRKDGKPWEQETSSGGVVPNSDGTYHTWISVKIEPKDRDRYWCHVEHAGLLEPLDLPRQESASVGRFVGVFFGVMAAILMVAGIIFYRNKQQDGCKGTSTSNGQTALAVEKARESHPE
ncbi:major histocompatibility complex class I-related gene protein-like [Elgaria multicarinata webbii]|uniref:major histocompatibility complex class I-related gene protein-like n=1 Tax=Elgaria multicarinata webbii TaxID=159646 RepID=UPI002FCD37BB